ncbi:trimethyllysine dioxygenase, mitochondrial [Malaya genurostris]|uniref:trimethyllysine dioxygenase, mitochondrial n=1 Tax=Malaya genurostris TaxID=325434 RepID=UPI0026F3C940|nr:trimethyllysine dioxygenase, mitochondrial [Malaya genurostris]
MAKPRPCVVPCCQGERFELVHKFPSDRDRAELWKSILAVPELRDVDVDIIRGKYFVCSRHFRDSDYKNKLSRSLNITANPSLNLFSLTDSEGLNRVVPPLVRPLPFPESTKDGGSFVTSTVELRLQPIAAQFVPQKTVDQILTDEKDTGSFDSLSDTEQTQEYTSVKKEPHLDILKQIPSQKRCKEVRTLAGSTPAKIFKFKRGSDILKLDMKPVDRVPGSDGIVLRKIKLVSPKKDIPQSAERKILTVSSETQTDSKYFQHSETNQSIEEADAKVDSDTKNTTKVLALLECTPENLIKLQRKLKEKSDGSLPFDENLFQDLASNQHDEEEEEKTGAMADTDERFFLTLHNTESDQSVRVSYVWLRDHCRCNECYNHVTFQRSVCILDIPENMSPQSFKVDEKKLDVIWNDGHVSSYDLDFIFQSQFEVYRETLLQEHAQPVLWDRDLIGLCPEYCRVSLSELICEDSAVTKVVKSLIAYGVAFIEKVPTNQQSTEMAVKRIFPVHKTLFGEMWTFSDQMDHGDTAYTKNYLGPHTDTTYFSDASGLQILHCIQFNGTGGDTMLIDGFKVAEQLKIKDTKAFERLCSYPLMAEYKEEGKHHTYCAPVIKRNITTGEVEQLRFNMYDRAVNNTIPQKDMPQFYADLKRLAAEINDESMVWKFRLTPGTVLIFDNWRVLHGRTAYFGKRVMTGCYVARTEFQSVARTLGLIL